MQDGCRESFSENHVAAQQAARPALRGRRAAVSLLALFLLVGTASGQATAPAVQRPTSRPASQPAARHWFESYGVAFELPPGFRRDTDGQQSIAIYVSGDRQELPDELLWVDVFRAGNATLDDVARALAKNEDLVREDKPRPWGGAEAVSLTSRAVAGGNKLLTTRLLLHQRDGWIYRLRHATRGGHRSEAVFDRFVAETWWMPVGPAGAGVNARMPFLRLANGAVVSVPDPFRPEMDAKGGKLVSTFMAVDMRNNRPAARLMVVPLPRNDSPLTLEQLTTDAAANLGQPLGLNASPTWDVVPGSRPGAEFAVTPLMPCPAGTVRMLAAMQDGSATVFTLQIPKDADPESAQGMDDVMSLIVESMQAIARPGPATAPAGPATRTSITRQTTSPS